MNSPWGILRENRALRRLWIGALVSGIGDSLTWLALTWHVVERTGSGAAVGTLLLCIFLPGMVTGAPLGRLLDRLSARNVMLADNVLRALIVALIPLLTSRHALSLTGLYVLAGACGALSPATRAGMRLLAPRLVDDGSLEAANAALGWTEHLPGIFGAPIAGVLIAAWGALGALWLDAGSFLFMALALASVTVPPAKKNRDGQEGGAKKSSATPLLLLKYPSVALVTALTAAFSFAYGPTEAALPLLVRTALHADARGLGWIWGSLGAGAAVGNAFVGVVSARMRTGTALALIALFWGIFQGFLSQSAAVWQAALWMFLGGIAWGPYLALESTFVQRAVPPEEHGSVFGAHTAALAPMLPLGTALGGFLMRFLAPSQVILGSALACVAASAAGSVYLARRKAGR